MYKNREIDLLKILYVRISPGMQKVIDINQPLANLIHRQYKQLPQNWNDYIGTPISRIHRPTQKQLLELKSEMNIVSPSSKLEIAYLTLDSSRFVNLGFEITARYNQNTEKLLDYIIQGQVITDKVLTNKQEFIRQLLIKEQATHDPLTGLYNRRVFDEQLEIKKSSRNPVAIGFFDLNKFKQLNDQLGHPSGDKHLIDFANFLTSHFRSEDIIARYGGDEFIALLTDKNLNETNLSRKVSEIKESTVATNQLRARLSLPTLDFSFAFVLAEKRGSFWEIEAAKAKADVAMYKNKNT